MYGNDISEGQKKELARLESDDLSRRYGTRVGPRKFPSALILAEVDEEIVGCVGLDPQVTAHKYCNYLI